MRVKQNLSDFVRQADLVLLGLCTASTLFGILVIASATRHTGSNKFVVVQSLGMLLISYGILNAIGQSLMPPCNSSLIGQLHTDTRGQEVPVLLYFLQKILTCYECVI